MKIMTIKDRIAVYWDKSAQEYHQASPLQNEHDRAKTEKWQDLFCDKFPDDARKILDVGTGPGAVAVLIAEKGFDVTGVDLSSQMLKYARENAHKKGLSIKFEECDTESLPFEDGVFDVVVSRHLLWTTTDPEIVLREWLRVLRPGGRLVYCDGNWYKSDNTLKRDLWQKFSAILTIILEHRIPDGEDLSEEVKGSLWSVKADRPTYDHDLLVKIGFTDIQITDSIEPLVSDWVSYLKEGYWGPRFLISATKEG